MAIRTEPETLREIKPLSSSPRPSSQPFELYPSSIGLVFFLLKCFSRYLNWFFCFNADSSFVPPLIYSALGSSRHLVVGPGSIASLVLATMLGGYVSPSDQPILYLQLAFTATFFAGVFQTSLGLLRYSLLPVRAGLDFSEAYRT